MMKKTVALLLAVLLLGSSAASAAGPLNSLLISKRIPSEDVTGVYEEQAVTVNLYNLRDDATEQMKAEFHALTETDDIALDRATLETFNKELPEAPEFCTFTDPQAVCRSWILARAEGADAWATWPPVHIVAESYPVIVTLPVEDPDSVIALLLYANDEWYVPEEVEPYKLDDGTGVIDFELAGPSHITILRPLGDDQSSGFIPSPERSVG